MLKIIGADSETCNGHPITFQFWSFDNDYTAIFKVTKKSSFKTFIKYCNSLPSDDTTYVMFIHNLKFDMVSFFYDRLEILKNEVIDYEYGKWRITGIYSSTTFLSMFHANSHKTIRLIDTSAFFMGSLENLSKLFTPTLQKLSAPPSLGKKVFSLTNNRFVKYAMRDAEICAYIGKYICELHEEYDIPISVSAPQMASKIFRKNYVKKTIPLPDKAIIFSAMNSFHGGKNDWCGKKGLYKNVMGLDIVSAYPFAMSQMPSFYHKELYKTFYHKNFDNKSVPIWGIYRISGSLKKCEHPIICNHEFKYLLGDIDKIWTTGPELNEALRSKELVITDIFGYYYDHEKDHNVSPIKMYVEEFFELKNKEKDEIKRTFYKIMLNSLYGKFIQAINRSENITQLVTIKKNGEIKNDRKNTREAGGLFHPFIATLITGYTRAQIHKMEHNYNAIHTSTDGIICPYKNIKRYNTRLGGFKKEFEGDALILRNKLYIIYNKKGEKIKYALHGFHGKVDALEQCWKNDDWEYKYIKVNKLKESLNRGLIANNFESRKAKLKLGD